MTPTLVASRTALPPGGAVLAWGGPALRMVTPTLPTSCGSLPSEGAAAPADWRSQIRGPGWQDQITAITRICKLKPRDRLCQVAVGRVHG